MVSLMIIDNLNSPFSFKKKQEIMIVIMMMVEEKCFLVSDFQCNMSRVFSM